MVPENINKPDDGISAQRALLNFLHTAASGQTESVLVPLVDEQNFDEVVEKICVPLATGAYKVCLLADGQTAEAMSRLFDPSRPSATLVAFGTFPREKLPEGIELIPNLPEAVSSRERFIVVVSPVCSAVAVMETSCGAEQDSGRLARPFGYWCVGRDVALRMADQLLLGTTLDVSPESAAGSWRTEEPWSSILSVVSSSAARSLAGSRGIELAQDNLLLVLDILKNISTLRRAHDILYIFVESMAKAVHMARCSVVRIWKDKTTGYVVASHDDPSVTDIPIKLEKYPEVLYCLNHRATLVIDDVQNDRLVEPVAELLERANINSLMVTPILLDHEEVGSLVLRAARRTEPFSLREQHFCEIVANAAANALERAHLFESIQAANERLGKLAVTDELTGLYNQRYFRTRLLQEFQRADRYHVPLSCMIMDIDDFKWVNDNWGHLQGDIVLRQVAHGIQQQVRRTDILARYGGEEFVLIMPQTDADGALVETTRLHGVLETLQFTGMDKRFRMTTSCGVATFDRGNMATPEALLRCADVALYRAKNANKNSVVAYDEN